MKYSFLNSHEESLSKKESTSSRQAHLQHNKKGMHFKSQYACTYMYSFHKRSVKMVSMKPGLYFRLSKIHLMTI